MKTVGKQSRIPATPEEAVLRAGKIIAEAFRVSPIKKPRGFVVKFKTWEDHEAWHQSRKKLRPQSDHSPLRALCVLRG